MKNINTRLAAFVKCFWFQNYCIYVCTTINIDNRKLVTKSVKIASKFIKKFTNTEQSLVVRNELKKHANSQKKELLIFVNLWHQ